MYCSAFSTLQTSLASLPTTAEALVTGPEKPGEPADAPAKVNTYYISIEMIPMIVNFKDNFDP